MGARVKTRQEANKKKGLQFNKLLFSWYKKYGRDLPWRRTKNPYRIVVSELMLQQTQVERVKEKYQEFLRVFPNVEVLASASLGDVLRVWSGLGYNRRAKYLHQMAKTIIEEHNGKFPTERQTLLTLPGIGPSTASALGAFAFERDEAMIDTNIRRVLCRVFFQKRIPKDSELYTFANTLIPKGKGREWNYAVMDIASKYCKARGHNDEDCPLARLHGDVDDFVYKKPQSTFAGSPRFYRGQVIKYLVEKNKGVRGDQVISDLGFGQNEIVRALESLQKEGLVRKRGKYFSLTQ